MAGIGSGPSGVLACPSYGQINTNGVFKGKRALLSLTTGGPAPAYLKSGFNGDIHAILRPIQRGILQFVGFEVLAPQIAYGPARLQQGQRKQLLRRGGGKRLVLLGRQCAQAMTGLRGNDDAGSAARDDVAKFLQHERGAIQIDLEDRGR